MLHIKIISKGSSVFGVGLHTCFVLPLCVDVTQMSNDLTEVIYVD